MDFTLKKYSFLLDSLQKAGYGFLTFEKYMSEIKDGNPAGKVIILRHDVDKKPENSLLTAQIEHDFGIRASYYFRAVKKSFNAGIIRKITDLKHEIGYHYEDLSLFHGDKEKAWKSFRKQLEYFRRYYPVQTICMHGSPASRYDNRDLWKEFSYKESGIIGEPYFDFLNRESSEASGKYYFTDTGRCWDGEKYNVRDKIAFTQKHPQVHSTDELVHFLLKLSETEGNVQIMITTHPQRWSNCRLEWVTEYLFQNAKNKLKFILARSGTLK